MEALAINWGDVPTWLQGTTSLLALLAAGVAVKVSYDVFQLERQREDRAEQYERERRDREERSETADHVAAWLHSDDERLAEVQNGSRQPIRQVRLEWHTRTRKRYTRHIDVIPPGERTQYRVSQRPPAARFPVDGFDDEDDSPLGIDGVALLLYFTDTGGREWMRDQDGNLRLLGRRIVAGPAVESDRAIGPVVREGPASTEA